jgi:hypothetical protein
MLTPNEQMQLVGEVEKAQIAKDALDKYFGEFFEDKERILLNAFRTCAIGDKESLCNVHMMFKSLDSLKHDLLVKIETGKMAEFQIEEDSKQTDKETKQ